MLPTAERMGALPAGLCRAVALRACMTRSVVSVADPQPHAALGLPAYVQFTSPIRRYSDLLAHYQVRPRPAPDRTAHSAAERSQVQRVSWWGTLVSLQA